MQFTDKILFDESIKTKKREKILGNLENGGKLGRYEFVIRVCEGPGILEIVPERELRRLEQLSRAFVVLAVASNKEKAYAIILGWMDMLVNKYNRILSDDLDKEFDITWL